MYSDKNDEKRESALPTETSTVEYLKGLIKHLQEENKLLEQELSTTKQAPTNKIGFAFLIVGVLAFFASVVSSSTPLALIGLGVTFWGTLFMFVRPIRFVRATLLDWTAVSSYATIDRILEDLRYKGQGIYIPPFPKEVYLPEHLKNLKEIIVYITADNVLPQVAEKFPMPNLDEIARACFLLKNPRGITIIPPGNGLMDVLEKELKVDFSKVKLDYIQKSVPRLISDLQLAQSAEIKKSHWLVDVTIKNSIYEDLYSPKRGLKSVHIVGCPLASALACALAKTTGKLVTIVKDQVLSESHEVKIWYKMLES
jgi:hypothetical protein